MKVEKSPLHKKHRPKTWAEIVGKKNQATCENLRSVLREGNVHLYLLVGPSGCGKTTIARLIKDALGCSDVDFTDLNAGNDRGIDSIRQLIHEQEFYPLDGEVKVILIDECHRLTKDSWEALLKVTEEPAPGTYFIFATTNPEKIPPTMINRCGGPAGGYKVHKVEREEMRDFLKGIDDKEDAGIPLNVMNEILTQADGSPRQALILFEKVMNLGGERSMLDALEGAGEETTAFNEVIHSLLLTKDWAAIVKYFENPDADPEKIRRAILIRMSQYLVSENAPEKTKVEAARIMPIFLDQSISVVGNSGLIYACWKVTGCCPNNSCIYTTLMV